MTEAGMICVDPSFPMHPLIPAKNPSDLWLRALTALSEWMVVDCSVLSSKVLTVANVLDEKWSLLALHTLPAEVRGKPSYCCSFSSCLRFLRRFHSILNCLESCFLQHSGVVIKQLSVWGQRRSGLLFNAWGQWKHFVNAFIFYDLLYLFLQT